MERKAIDIETLAVKPYDLFEGRWLLLTSGDFQAARYNSMTISWGSLGVIWGRPFAQVVVRPGRYTFEFMEHYDSFTLCSFPPALHPALELLGARSGRDGDKIRAAGLTPTAATRVGAPVFAEAELAIECRKIYWQDFDPDHFLDPEIARNYPRKDYHRIYYGEIVAVQGLAAYTS
jgi:flavin reductase (DIM6/NTAB) family NADH-FMN oxidoreductase RutF